MPQYRVLQKSFIGNRIVEEGEIIDYDGEVSENLEPVEKEKKGAKYSAPAQSSDSLA